VAASRCETHSEVFSRVVEYHGSPLANICTIAHGLSANFLLLVINLADRYGKNVPLSGYRRSNLDALNLERLPPYGKRTENRLTRGGGAR
jgi:hypothetical protein